MKSLLKSMLIIVAFMAVAMGFITAYRAGFTLGLPPNVVRVGFAVAGILGCLNALLYSYNRKVTLAVAMMAAGVMYVAFAASM